MKQSIRAGIVAGLSLTMFYVVAGAQEASAPLTLEQSIEIALRQSVVIQSAREGVAASEARKKKALTGFLPKLSTTYNYPRNDPAPYIKQPPPSPITSLTIGTQDNYTWSLDAKQPLFTGGRLEANYDISRLGLDASKQEEMGTVQDIVLEVRRSYFTILKAKRLVGVAKQSVEQFVAQKDLAKSFYEVGLAAALDKRPFSNHHGPRLDRVEFPGAGSREGSARQWHHVSPMQITPDSVLEFWFGPPPHVARDQWFRKDAAFDASIRERFSGAVSGALAGEFRSWCTTPLGTLARVILLDQFTRNIHRDTPLAFAGDSQALADAMTAVDRGFDRQLDRYERWFLLFVTLAAPIIQFVLAYANRVRRCWNSLAPRSLFTTAVISLRRSPHLI